MGQGDFGFDGLHSLSAVNSWIAVINGNLNAASRTGYKTTKVKFRGGVTDVQRSPNGPLLGVQTPETTLQIDQSSIDFSQGSIITSTEPTHLAIQGEGFFSLSIGDGTGGSPAAAINYYTRDGEFHLVDQDGSAATTDDLLLVHSTGLYLVDAAGDLALFDLATQRVTDNGGADFTEVNLIAANTPEYLRFSRYGSTVFEDLGDATTVAVVAGDARVITQSLESSNSSLSQTLPELSLAQKFFSAVTKVISVHQTNLDTVINLVR